MKDSQWPPKELRRHARKEQHIPVQLFQGRARGKKGSGAGVAIVQDLSRRGLLLRTPVPMPVGEGLAFSLSLPNGRNVRGNAAVRWTQPQGINHVVGLEIVDMGYLHARRLHGYLMTRKESQALKFADLALEGAVWIVLLFVARELILSEPSIGRTVTDIIPLGLIALTPVLGVFVVLRSRF
ncbi:MAG: PilZ domain-containing protein [Elusimicrobia bacterium]|nr:PilZ domain-containing protein [Elusimicrobiota bacterium]